MIILTGMPGSGKDEFVKVARELGYSDVHMGETVKEYVKEAGVPMIDSEIGQFASAERKSHGMDIWAKRTAERINDPEKTIVDGLRNIEELEFFKRHYDSVIVVAIYANRQERLNRILKRNRIDDVRSENELEMRDGRELTWGIGRTISLADHMIVNDGTLEQFHNKVRVFLSSLVSSHSS